MQPRQCISRCGWSVSMLFTLIACQHRSAVEAIWTPLVSEDLTTQTVDSVGFENPTAIVYDPVSDLYLVSNADEDVRDPARRQGRGFISRVTPGGKVEELRWIDGATAGVTLNEPQGMAIRGDTLYVADLDCVRLFDLATGVPEGSVCPSGAKHLKDVAVDANGLVYVTDTGGGKLQEGVIYAIEPNGAQRVLMRGRQLGEPNGIATGPRGVFAVGFASGSVYQLTPDGPHGVATSKGWHLSGIVFTRDGSFLFANQADSTILYVRAKDGGARGDVFTLAHHVVASGSLGYDARRDRVMVPIPSEDGLFFVDLAR